MSKYAICCLANEQDFVRLFIYSADFAQQNCSSRNNNFVETNEKSVNNLLKQISKKCIIYSKLPDENLSNYNILIIDVFGILKKLYAYSNIAYVGGGFNRGVHNTLEPAVYGNTTCFGNNIELLDEAIEMVDRKCGFIIKKHSDCFDILRKTFVNKEFKDNLEVRCNNFIKQKYNDSKKIIEVITNV